MDAGDAVTVAKMLPRRAKRAVGTAFMVLILALDCVSTKLAESVIRSTARAAGYAYCQHVRGEINDALNAAAPGQTKLVCRY
jgi:hypothetical protein